MPETVVVQEIVNDVIVLSPGPQGPRGKTILNGNGAPAANLGFEGDFYYDKVTTKFYGPKLVDNSWDTANSFFLSTGTLTYPYSLPMLVAPVPPSLEYTVTITHNLGYHPNVTVKNSAGDILETGIVYNSLNVITLTMAQPFSGTAYLS